jgi:hypothetical protein
VFSRLPFQVAYFHHGMHNARSTGAIETFKPDHVLCQLVRTTEYVRQPSHAAQDPGLHGHLEQGHGTPHRNAPFCCALVPAETRRLIRYENLMFDLFDHTVIISAQDRDYIYHPLRDRVR